MKQLSRKAVITVFLTLILAGSLFAQVDVSTATLSGTVLDPNNAPVPGAAITVTNVEKGITKQTASDEKGEYRIPSLQPGKYEIKVEAQGFQGYLGQNISLTVGQEAHLDISLKVGEVATVVTVDTEVPLIESTRTQQANTIEQRQIESLPNINRSYTDIVFTLPGVVANQSAYVQASSRSAERIAPTSGISIGGTSGRNNYVSIDGGENDIGSGGLRIKDLSVEAVQEYQVNRNGFNAEFGFTTGTALNVVTKSGTNEWNGAGYLFYRSDKTSARNALDFGATKPTERRIFPGFYIGGPIVKNKAFLFSSFEGLWFDEGKIRNYTSDPSLLTTNASQNAYLATLAASTNTAVQAIGASLRSRLTVSNSASTMKILNDSQTPFTAPNKTKNWLTRFDYQPNSNDSFLFRFSVDDSDTFLLSNDNADSPSFGVTNKQRDYTFLTSWSRAFSSGSVNQLRFQYAYITSVQGPDPKGPGLQVQGVINYGPPQILPSDFTQKRFQFEDVFAFSKGTHNFKTGLTLRPIKGNFKTGIVPAGFFVFAQVPLVLVLSAAERTTLAGAGLIAGAQTTQMSSLQAVAAGAPATWLQGFGNQNHSALQENTGLFIQDSWKVTNRLSLDYGLRFQHDGQATPLSDNNDFAPRLALAWDVFGRGKTVIRGGAGKYDAPIGFHILSGVRLQREDGVFLSLNTVNTASTPTSVALWQYGVGLGALPFTALTQAQINAFGIATGPFQANRRITRADSKYVNPVAYQAGLSIQQQVMKDWSIELGYVFYRGNHINRTLEGNFAEAATCALNSPTCAFGPNYVRRNAAIAQEIVYSSSGNSTYHGGTLSITKRFSNYYQFQANYTYSKALDDVFDFTSASAPPFYTRLYLDWGRSGFDIRHNFVASGIIASPWKDVITKNMTLSPIVQIRTGIPFNLYTGAANGDNINSDRPFYASRNSGNGPGYFNVNLRLAKKILFKDDAPNGFRLELFSEITNLLNTVNYLSVNDFIGTTHPLIAAGNFNISGDRTLPRTSPLGFTNAYAARQFQFGFKFGF